MKGEELITYVAGIPCRVRVTHLVIRTPSSQWDEPTECEFDVLDRRSRPAPWLEAKLTRDDTARISAEIQEAARIDWRYA
jgi:hypothetical protein